MKLPNGLSAVIDVRKLVEYALDSDNPRGRHKARVFKAVLEIDADNAEQLRLAILNAVQRSECIIGE